MAMKKYSIFPKAPRLEPHYHFVLCYIQDWAWTLLGAITPGRSEPVSDGNEGVFYVHQSFKTGASVSDGLISRTLVVIGESYSPAEMQSVYSTTLDDWAWIISGANLQVIMDIESMSMTGYSVFPQRFKTGAPLSDCLVSYSGHSLEEGVLFFCRDAVRIFYSLCWLGLDLIRCNPFESEWTLERCQWRGTSYSPKVQDWSLAIRLFSIISRTLVGRGGSYLLKRCSRYILQL